VDRLQTGLTGALFAATLAAAVSSWEVLILNAGLQCATDIIAPFSKLSSDKIARLSKLLVLPFAAIIVIVSVTRPESLVGMLLMTYGWLVQLFPAILGMFFWKRATKAGAAVGLVTGTVISILFSRLWPNPLSIHAGVWGLAANVILFVVISLLTSPPPKEIVDEYFDLHEYQEEEKAPV
jgi:SSS family solute:Na+ symporter